MITEEITVFGKSMSELRRILAWHESVSVPGNIDVVPLRAVREAVADYMHAEGCSCCRDMKAHKEAAKRLGELLNVPPYKDGSGYEFSTFRSKK